MCAFYSALWAEFNSACFNERDEFETSIYLAFAILLDVCLCVEYGYDWWCYYYPLLGWIVFKGIIGVVDWLILVEYATATLLDPPLLCETPMLSGRIIKLCKSYFWKY